jgi:hypothetical protein
MSEVPLYLSGVMLTGYHTTWRGASHLAGIGKDAPGVMFCVTLRPGSAQGECIVHRQKRGMYHKGRFGVSGFGFRVSGFGFRISGLGFRVSGFGTRVSDLGFRISGLGFGISGPGSRVSGFRFAQVGGGRHSPSCHHQRVTYMPERGGG